MGVAWGAAIAVVAYAGIRVLERALFLEPNPAMLLWADRSPFVWRAIIALYIGGAGVFGGFVAARRASASAARGLFLLVATATAAVVVQGALWP
jgi:hypothetical protein